MAYMGTFCFVMATGPFSNYKRFLLITGGLLMFMAMAYAGSRTPFVLVPFGLVVFTMLTLKKEILIAMGCFFFIGTAAVLKSTSNPVIYRLQSAFIPSRSDDTMDVRFKNQKFIQPFIYRHPFGAGLGSCGDWGKRFSPDTMLANFAHDSGFVRVAVELGWVGLILYSYFLFTVLQTSVYYYLRVKDPTIKVFYLSIITIFFQLVLASYPQEVIIQLPNSIIFLSCLAAVYRMKDFDEYYMSGGKILPIEEKVKEEKLLIQEPVSNDII